MGYIPSVGLTTEDGYTIKIEEVYGGTYSENKVKISVSSEDSVSPSEIIAPIEVISRMFELFSFFKEHWY